MNQEEFNLKALNDIYKNAHIALQSITDLLPAVQDKELKQELESQYQGYENCIENIKKVFSEKNETPKDINFMKKAMLWGSIKMKTLMNSSRNQVAEMMINGTVMGINELTAMKNESENLNQDTLACLDQLLSLEEEYEQRLKKFL